MASEMYPIAGFLLSTSSTLEPREPLA